MKEKSINLPSKTLKMASCAMQLLTRKTVIGLNFRTLKIKHMLKMKTLLLGIITLSTWTYLLTWHKAGTKLQKLGWQISCPWNSWLPSLKQRTLDSSKSLSLDCFITCMWKISISTRLKSTTGLSIMKGLEELKSHWTTLKEKRTLKNTWEMC